jgi:hypothetical protein
MKSICAVLGLALLMGCANNDCPRKEKDCGKRLTTQEASAIEKQEVAQETSSVLENVTPSK